MCQCSYCDNKVTWQFSSHVDIYKGYYNNSKCYMTTVTGDIITVTSYITTVTGYITTVTRLTSL